MTTAANHNQLQEQYAIAADEAYDNDDLAGYEINTELANLHFMIWEVLTDDAPLDDEVDYLEETLTYGLAASIAQQESDNKHHLLYAKLSGLHFTMWQLRRN